MFTENQGSSGFDSSTRSSEFTVRFSSEIVSNGFTATGESSITGRFTRRQHCFKERSRARFFFIFLENEAVDHVKLVLHPS